MNIWEKKLIKLYVFCKKVNFFLSNIIDIKHIGFFQEILPDFNEIVYFEHDRPECPDCGSEMEDNGSRKIKPNKLECIRLSEDKTCITTIFKGFNFLGFNAKIEKDNKCIIKPSRDSIKKAKGKIRDIFEYAKGQNVEYLIDKLIPVIDGIAEFWKSMVSSKAFSNLDNYIWKKTWKFLKHLHHNKSSAWIVNKYFPKPEKDDEHQDKWILTEPNTGKQLKRMSWTKIERHTMIKHDYSPLDKSKSNYFYKRSISATNKFR